MRKILVYVDEGAAPRCVRFLFKTLRELEFLKNYSLVRVDRDHMRESEWENDAALLIFPGGRDIHYQEALRGPPNLRIRNFIQKGGRYLGICAGGYYGSAEIEFEKGYPLEVIDDRELGFFPGLARGSAYGPNQFCYHTDRGSRAAEITWMGEEEGLTVSSVYFNGGCEFVDAGLYPNTTILAKYSDIPNAPTAIVQCEFGRGRAILCGVHPEYKSAHLSEAGRESQKLISKLLEAEKSRHLLFKSLLKRLLT